MSRFTKFHLAEQPKIVTQSIPGARSQELLALQQQIEGSVVSYPRSNPIAFERAKGAIVEDVDGNQFIDFFAGAGVVNLGHSNEEVLAYVTAQQEKLIHALDFPTANKLSAIQKILSHLPEHLQDQYKVSFGGPTGSDAIEAALKLAKIKTGRDTIIAFTGGYHGMTAGALSLTSDTAFRNRLTSLTPNVHFVPYSYCYRCPFKLDESNCKMACVDYLRNVLENGHSGIPKPAAIVIEPIQGEGGNIVPREGYLEALVKLAHAHDVLVIFDEIQCGFFRSGEFLAWMHTDAVPDIITISKGIGGVGLPLAGLIYRKEVEAWGPAAHIGTFRGNQASLAGTNGAFDFVDKYNVNEHTKEAGEYLMEGLRALQADSAYIGDVRGRGLMIGVEFVKDKNTKEPYPSLVKRFRSECLQRGLIFEVGGHYNNVVRFVPPLIITTAIIDAALAVMKEALEVSTAALKEEGRLALI
ncbi:aspartate aminotransferase family protein [Chitinophaga vietnamensis]|uniref:aspartate aminotransferase family protein n=1 Tax=Chitinophaga vietnamensis TaxID=2593957 RepID=UPI001178730E|nr:aspartate aminotransferase family protein [Chitinophaga vietnamensis]